MEDLTQLKVLQLRKLAKGKVDKYYNMNKHELIVAIQNYEREMEKKKERGQKEKLEVHIEPIKRNTLTDFKIELFSILRELDRNPKREKKGYSDIFEGKEIKYTFFTTNDVNVISATLMIEKDDLLKTFIVNKGDNKMWQEIINYLKEMIYNLGEKIEDYFTPIDPPSSENLNRSGENQGELIEMVDLSENKEILEINEEKDTLTFKGEKGNTLPCKEKEEYIEVKELVLELTHEELNLLTNENFIKSNSIVKEREDMLKCPQKSRPQFVNRKLPSIFNRKRKQD